MPHEADWCLFVATLWPPKVGAYVESNEKSQSDDSHADSVQADRVCQSIRRRHPETVTRYSVRYGPSLVSSSAVAMSTGMPLVKTQICRSRYSGRPIDATVSKMFCANDISARDVRR
jgi:hypothetical protein